MFHKYNPFTNTLSPADQISAYKPESFGTKEATNNFFVAPQPKGSKPGVLANYVEKVSSTGLLTAKAHTSSHAEASSAGKSHGHAHGDHHPAPWEGVNLWRTPYKGDVDTVTHVKRNKGSLDQYIENRTRRIQQLQLAALRNKQIPTWVMMPRDKILLAAQGVIVAYVLYQVSTTVYQHLKSKDRLKLLKLLYKDNVN